MATKIRQTFKAKVEAIIEKEQDPDVDKLEDTAIQLPVLNRNYLPTTKQPIGKEMLEGHEHNTASLKRKRRTLSEVSAEMRLEIVKMAATKTRTHREIGEIFKVRTSAVSSLSSALKRSKSTIVKRR